MRIENGRKEGGVLPSSLAYMEGCLASLELSFTKKEKHDREFIFLC